MSDNGAAAAIPLRIVCHEHPVVCAVDVVDIGLSSVPVTHFCEGDQLDGLALRKQLARKNFSALFKSLACSRTVHSSLLPVGQSACSGVGIWTAIVPFCAYLPCTPLYTPKLWVKLRHHLIPSFRKGRHRHPQRCYGTYREPPAKGTPSRNIDFEMRWQVEKGRVQSHFKHFYITTTMDILELESGLCNLNYILR